MAQASGILWLNPQVMQGAEELLRSWIQVQVLSARPRRLLRRILVFPFPVVSPSHPSSPSPMLVVPTGFVFQLDTRWSDHSEQSLP